MSYHNGLDLHSIVANTNNYFPFDKFTMLNDNGSRNTLHILLITIELHLPNAHSLKEKRSSIKSCIERLKNSLNASVAEVAFTDKWQRSVIAMSVVGTDKFHMEKSLGRAENIVTQLSELSIVRIERQWL